MIVRDKLYINGTWVAPEGDGVIDVINPATEQLFGQIPEGTGADVNHAVAAAKAAFTTWSVTSVEERAQMLESLHQVMSTKISELGTLIAGEVGMPLRLSMMIQAGLPTTVMGSYAQIVRDFVWEEEMGTSLVIREPIGVVGCITPWNYPLHQLVAKVAAAIAAGCTVVVKPSEVAPLSAFALADIMHEVGLPAGVFNLVSGPGSVVGEAIASHPDVAMVSFTGSTRVGKRIVEIAAATMKRTAMELGGKSANILLNDAKFDDAVNAAVTMCFLNSGQTCTALTRLLVPRDRLQEVEQLAVAAAQTFKLGDPMDEKTRLGPVASAQQLERVRSAIRAGIEEGANLLCGGPDAPADLEVGYFVQPTVFSDVDNKMTIAQQEIFGPVLVIIPYDTEDEAVAIANDSVYGLSGAVTSKIVDRAVAVARRLKTGQVSINGGAFDHLAPFGGYKQSGVGRELGRFGLEEFLETKALQR